MKLFERLKRFFRREKAAASSEKENFARKGIVTAASVGEVRKEIETQVRADMEARRQAAVLIIARKNEERQKATLGYGLKSRNFRPRPAAEKRLWNMSKKPVED